MHSHSPFFGVIMDNLDDVGKAILWLMIGFVLGHLATLVALMVPIGG